MLKLGHIKERVWVQSQKISQSLAIWILGLYQKYSERFLINGLEWFYNKQAIQNCPNKNFFGLVNVWKHYTSILKWSLVYETFIFFKLSVIPNYHVEIKLTAGFVHLAYQVWDFMKSRYVQRQILVFLLCDYLNLHLCFHIRSMYILIYLSNFDVH